MKAKTKCPNCQEIVMDDCMGCVSGGSLMHSCGEDKEPGVYDVEWEIVECTNEEAEDLRKLGFKGEISEDIK